MATRSEPIILKNVRLSFPSLGKNETFGGDDTGKRSATFILNKKEHAEQIKQIKVEVEALTKELKVKKLPSDKIALKDGDDQGREEFEGAFTIKAAGDPSKVVVIDRAKRVIPESDRDVICYPGCYVNAKIHLWAQDNQWGKRVNSGLDAVQFFADGEPFGSGPASVDEFEEFEDDDDDMFD